MFKISDSDKIFCFLASHNFSPASGFFKHHIRRLGTNSQILEEPYESQKTRDLDRNHFCLTSFSKSTTQ